MTTILLVIHLIVTLVMIGLILLQRSEGGGLGIGGGGMGAFATPRSTANALTRATMACFALFVILSLVLAILAGRQGTGGSLIQKLDQVPAAATAPVTSEPVQEPEKPAEGTKTAPQVPLSQ